MKSEKLGFFIILFLLSFVFFLALDNQNLIFITGENLSDAFNDSNISNNTGWTSYKINSEIQNANITSLNFTEGSVPFVNANGTLSEDNSNFFWDDTNNKLRFGNNNSIYSPSNNVLNIGAQGQDQIEMDSSAMTITPNPVGTRSVGQLTIDGGIDLFPSYATRGSGFNSKGLIDFSQTFTSPGPTQDIGFTFNPKINTDLTSGIYLGSAVAGSPSFTHTINMPSGVYFLFLGSPSVTVPNTDNVNPMTLAVFDSNPRYKIDGGNNSLGTFTQRGFHTKGEYIADTFGNFEANSWIGYVSDFTATSILGGTVNVNEVVHFKANPSIENNVKAVINNEIGLYIPDMTASTKSVGIKSENNGAFFIEHEGSAPSYFEGDVGIGTNNSQNALDVAGAQVIGSSYSGVNTAPTDGLLVEGNVGIGTTNPSTKLEVNGVINATSIIAQDGFTGNCINTSFISGIAMGCND